MPWVLSSYFIQLQCGLILSAIVIFSFTIRLQRYGELVATWLQSKEMKSEPPFWLLDSDVDGIVAFRSSLEVLKTDI